MIISLKNTLENVFYERNEWENDFYYKNLSEMLFAIRIVH